MNRLPEPMHTIRKRGPNDHATYLNGIDGPAGDLSQASPNIPFILAISIFDSSQEGLRTEIGSPGMVAWCRNTGLACSGSS